MNVAEENTCKRTLEFTVPASEVEAETERVLAKIQQKVKLPGFRPGKTPISLIKSRFRDEIRQEVLDALLPRVFEARAEKDQLRVVGTPKVTDVHLLAGEPLRFKAEFEVAPEIELGEYRGLEAPYAEPVVTEEDITARLDALREQKAEFVGIDPRPLADGDYAAVALKSIAGVEGEPVENEEMMLHIGDPETLPEFTECLRGVSPGETREVTVNYPAEYGSERLAGRQVTFEVMVKGLRRKELPEADDEFAQEMGDFKTIGELREELRRTLLREREFLATQEAKNHLVDALVAAHQFPVPEAYVDRQIEIDLEARLREMGARGVDLSKLRVDWEKLKESLRDRAIHEVKASLLLDRVGEREAIETMQDEVDREIHRLAKQMREPAAAVRLKMEKDGSLGRLANRIRTEKILSFLFEHARKVAPAPKAEE